MNSIQTEINLNWYLQTYFQYDAFHEGQREIMTDLLTGHDVLGILRTGTGKSLCYQLLAKILPGITIVVSPLISLMMDQVRECKALHFKEVVALHSFQSWKERQQILKQLQHIKLLFISPELLQNQQVTAILNQQLLSLFVVDEAHCISQWGYDFRPDYLRLTQVITQFGNPPVLALTGTATPAVQTDIKAKLARPQMIEHIYPMDRENISLVVEHIDGGNDVKIDRLMSYINQYHVPTLIYFSSRVTAERIANLISSRSPGRSVAFYHGGMETIDRIKIQQQFMNNQLDIICCTSAFGMGINKHNIRLIVHYHPPTQLESFIQEIGRAGRDGKDSVSVLLYRSEDYRIPIQIIENELPNQHELRFVYERLGEYHTNKQAIPRDEATIETLFQMQATKWRYICYQLEIHQVMHQHKIVGTKEELAIAFRAIHQFTKERLMEKRQNVAQMTGWLHTDTCLRDKLYEPFQQKITKKQINCCSNCGFTLKDWQVEEQDIDKEQHTDWQQMLKRILLIGEKH